MNIAFFVNPLDTVPTSFNHILAPWYLAENIIPMLVDRGHRVTTYCAQGSKLPGTVKTGGIGPSIDKIEVMDRQDFSSLNLGREIALAKILFQDAVDGRFDVIHIFQGIAQAGQFAGFVKTPVIGTMHDPFSPWVLDWFNKYNTLNNLFLTGLSQYHVNAAPAGLPRPCVVYNGIPLQGYPFSDQSGSYLLTSGRIVPEKGHHDAIAATVGGEKLVIAGKYYTHEAGVYDYWQREILPHIDGKRVRYVPFKMGESYRNLLAAAKALLFPIHWEEPFGLVMIEAMACGTPVIAYNRGSVPEIVKDGVTGFIVDPARGVDGLVEAVKRIGQIDRAACRKHVEDNFTVEKMVEGYEKVYSLARHSLLRLR